MLKRVDLDRSSHTVKSQLADSPEFLEGTGRFATPAANKSSADAFLSSVGLLLSAVFDPELTEQPRIVPVPNLGADADTTVTVRRRMAACPAPRKGRCFVGEITSVTTGSFAGTRTDTLFVDAGGVPVLFTAVRLTRSGQEHDRLSCSVEYVEAKGHRN
jgi:hypothetical protein